MIATRRWLACATVLAALLPGAGTPGIAHAEISVSFSPTVAEVDAEAGGTVTQPISVTAGDEPMVVELVHADFGFDDTSYALTLIRDDAPETTAFSTRGWFSLPRPRYRVPAHGTVVLPLGIDVPGNTPGGTYLGAALLRASPVADAPARAIATVPETGPLVFVTVAGGDPPKPELRRFDVPRLLGAGPVVPELSVGNAGDDHFSYEGTVTLSGHGEDRTVRIGRQVVVPGQPRTVTTSADAKGAAGRIELGSADLPFGRYEVTTRLRIDPTGTTLVATRTVWIVPTWLRIALVLAVVATLLSLLALARWAVGRREEPAEPADDTDPDESSDEDDGSLR